MFGVEDLRNIAIVGHGSCGKTTLTEAILFNAKAIPRMGRVEDGTTISDYGQDEIRRGISIDLSVLSCEYNGRKINILDTPGYQDFVGEAKKALAAVDGVLVVIDATEGVEVGTETMWNFANEKRLARIVFINKMDKENIDLSLVLESLKDNLGITPLLLQLPYRKGLNLNGVIDLISMKAFSCDTKEEIPKELEEEALRLREILVENIAETDDALTEKYLEGKELSLEELDSALCKAIMASKIIPVYLGSAERNIGIYPLLSAICKTLPSPIQRGNIGAIVDNKEEDIIPREDAPFIAQVFKVMVDPFVGELSLFRVYSGCIKPGDEVFNSTTSKTERVSHICLLHGKERKDLQRASCGDIAAFVKLKGMRTSDTILHPPSSIRLPRIEFPQSLTSLAVNPKTKADQEKLSQALQRLAEEDPTFSIRQEPELGQTIISGMGELHLEVMAERLVSRFGVEINLERPKIPYRETITTTAKGEGKHKKQSGGRGQYGHCFLEIEPLPPGSGFEFINKIFGGAIPSKYIPAIEKGVKETMAKGVLAGYPVIDTRVTVYDGSFHEVDSSDIAFQIAASIAFKKAFEEARPVLLEPIMDVEVIAPESDMGSVIGDLNSRRGRIQGVEPKGKNQIVRAYVPQAEMYKYSSTLRSLTGGRGSYSMKFSQYESVPAHLVSSIISSLQERV